MIGLYPRIETIVVPADVRLEYIGKYVSEKAVNILEEVGRAVLNAKSVALRPISERLYILSFETNVPYNSAQEGLQLRTPNTPELPVVAEVRVAPQYKKGSSKTN